MSRVVASSQESGTPGLMHKPCAFNPNGVSYDICLSLTKIPHRNQTGCTRIECTSAWRLCGACVRQGDQHPERVSKGKHKVGLCAFHEKEGPDTRRPWKSYDRESDAQPAPAKDNKKREAAPIKKPEFQPAPVTKVTPSQPEPVDAVEDPVTPIVPEVVEEEVLKTAEVTAPETEVQEEPAPIEVTPALEDGQDDPPLEEAEPPATVEEVPLPPAAGDHDVETAGLFGLSPAVRPFFSTLLPEGDRLTEVDVVLLAKFPQNEQLHEAINLVRAKKLLPMAPRPVVGVRRVMPPRSQPSKPSTQTVEKLQKFRGQVAPRVWKLFEQGKITETELKKLAQYAESLQMGLARELIAGAKKTKDL